jgi:hypothetical protein
MTCTECFGPLKGVLGADYGSVTLGKRRHQPQSDQARLASSSQSRGWSTVSTLVRLQLTFEITNRPGIAVEFEANGPTKKSSLSGPPTDLAGRHQVNNRKAELSDPSAKKVIFV